MAKYVKFNKKILALPQFPYFRNSGRGASTFLRPLVKGWGHWVWSP